MNSIAPQEIWRSEAFAEDLLEERRGTPRRQPRTRLLGSALLCAVPLVVAVLGGVMAFFHTMG
jgi:hypothetical protein